MCYCKYDILEKQERYVCGDMICQGKQERYVCGELIDCRGICSSISRHEHLRNLRLHLLVAFKLVLPPRPVNPLPNFVESAFVLYSFPF